jgi:hypothetical protein
VFHDLVTILDCSETFVTWPHPPSMYPMVQSRGVSLRRVRVG